MAPSPLPQITPFEPYTPWMGLLHRRARRMAMALVAAVRGTLAVMGPARCPSCREKVEPTDRYLRVVRHLGRPDGEAVRRLRLRGCGQARSGFVRSGSIPSSPMARASSSRLAAPVRHRPWSAA